MLIKIRLDLGIEKLFPWWRGVIFVKNQDLFQQIKNHQNRQNVVAPYPPSSPHKKKFPNQILNLNQPTFHKTYYVKSSKNEQKDMSTQLTPLKT